MIQSVYGIDNETAAKILGMKQQSFCTLKYVGSYTNVFTGLKAKKLRDAIVSAQNKQVLIRDEMDKNGYIVMYSEDTWSERRGQTAKAFETLTDYELAIHQYFANHPILLTNSTCVISIEEVEKTEKVGASEVISNMTYSTMPKVAENDMPYFSDDEEDGSFDDEEEYGNFD